MNYSEWWVKMISTPQGEWTMIDGFKFSIPFMCVFGIWLFVQWWKEQ